MSAAVYLSLDRNTAVRPSPLNSTTPDYYPISKTEKKYLVFHFGWDPPIRCGPFPTARNLSEALWRSPEKRRVRIPHRFLSVDTLSYRSPATSRNRIPLTSRPIFCNSKAVWQTRRDFDSSSVRQLRPRTSTTAKSSEAMLLEPVY